MKLHVLPSGPIQTNAYLLVPDVPGEAVLIDAPGDVWRQVAPILASSGCTLGGLWVTHGHWDHTQGGAEVVRESGARVVAHRADQGLIENPERMKRFMGLQFELEPLKVDQWVNEGDRIQGAGAEAEVRFVPGHCPGSVLFYFAAEGAAFVGDALFRGSVGRTDLPGGDFAVLERSIRSRIYSLPNETAVYSGHGPATTVGAEKRGNPHVRG